MASRPLSGAGPAGGSGVTGLLRPSTEKVNYIYIDGATLTRAHTSGRKPLEAAARQNRPWTRRKHPVSQGPVSGAQEKAQVVGTATLD